MRPENKRERIICIHEAAHLCMCYWNKIEFKEVRIKRKDDVTRGVGTIKLPPFPENWRTDPEATLELKALFYKYILIFSAGYLAEWMFAGEKAFWKSNRDFLEQTKKTDLQALREIAATIMKKEFRGILHIAHDTLSKPDHWGIIIDIGELLLKYRVIKGFPGVLIDESADDLEPEHDATELIKIISDGLYG